MNKIEVVGNKLNYLNVKYEKLLDEIEDNERKSVVITNAEEINKLHTKTEEMQKKMENTVNEKNEKIDKLKIDLDKAEEKNEELRNQVK